MAFTWWKLFASNQRRARLHRQWLLSQHRKQSDTYGGCVSAVSTRPRRRAPHYRECCEAVRDKNVPEPSTPPSRPEGKGVVFGFRTGLSSAGHHENNGQGERANPCANRDLRKHHERNTSPAMRSTDNRTPMLHMPQCFSNHGVGDQRSGEAAAPLDPRSPFVVGGSLCAKHPSYWTATGISAFNTVGPRPLVAWTAATAAEKQQQFSAQQNSTEHSPARGCQGTCRPPSEGGSKRRGLGMPPSRSASANRSKHRRIVPPTGLVSVVHHHNKSITSAFYDVSQDFPGRMRASSAPGRRTTNGTAVERGVGGRPLLHYQARLKTGDETTEGPPETRSMYFGQYMVLVD